MRKLIKKIAFPLLNKWYQAKTKKTSNYSKEGIEITIYPGVFHPGVFLSTNIFIDFLKNTNLSGLSFLELGAGSGMISFYAANQGAIVTATDINTNAIEGLRFNSKATQIPIQVVKSNLFENVSPNEFDWIIINPPYYPKNALNEKDQAFYCGEDFDYFKKLFQQLKQSWERETAQIMMILSEDCDIERISMIANNHGIILEQDSEVTKRGELNVIYRIRK